MFRVKFDYSEWKAIQEKLERVPSRALRITAEKARDESKNYLQSRIKWNRYRLITSISARRETTNRYEITSRGKPREYELFVHDGRGSFAAKNKKALHWIDQSGHDVFVRKPKKVKAFPGYHYYKHAAGKVQSNVEKYINQAVKEVGL